MILFLTATFRRRYREESVGYCSITGYSHVDCLHYPLPFLIPVYNRMMYTISIQFSADYIDDRHEH